MRGSTALVMRLLLLAAVSARAQVTTGTLSGYVLDPSGRPIARAEIVASDKERGYVRTAWTDLAGFYRIAELPPATYTVSARAQNFQTITTRALGLHVNTRLRVDFHLPLGVRKESLEVAAPALSLPTESSELGAVFRQDWIQSLPLNRRDFLQLALLAPGVLPPAQDSELSKRGSFAMHASGGREEHNNFLLDGVDNNDPYTNRYVLQPSVDSIQEFKIVTHSYSAEYGRSGAGQVNIVTRAGTNQWHGTFYEYLRNRALDARNFFDDREKPKFVRNQFGTGVGGPLSQDRSFFFASFDSLRERRGLSRLATVPDLEERSGRLSALGPTARDPLTRQPFPENTIPPARILPLALRVLELFPPPNRPGRSGNYLAQPVQRETDSQWSARFDQRLSAADQLTLRYSYGDQDLLEPFAEESTDLPGFGDIVRNKGHNALLHHQRVLAPQAIHSLRIGWGRTSRQAWPENYRTDVGRLWGVNWLNLRPRDFGFPFINIAGSSPAGDVTQLPIDRHTTTYQVSESIALTRGSHGWKAGGEIRHIRLAGILDFLARGSLSFSGAVSGVGLGDLLLGFPSFGIQAQFDNPQTLRSTALAFYLEDDWKVRPKLALNLGLRYEYNPPPTDPTNRMAALDLATMKVVRLGSQGMPRAGIRPDADNAAPRLGFAWTPARQLVLRGGYGVYYDAGMQVVNSSLYFNPPYFNVRVFFPTQNALLTLKDPFPATGGMTPPPTLHTLSPDWTTSYLQHWSLNAQTQLGSSLVAGVAYAGSKGTHLIRSRDRNQPRPGPGSVAARRPHGEFGGIFFIESGANSNFHSLQAAVDLRSERHFSLRAAYTFSKSIDDTSAFLGTKADKNFPQDSQNFRAERALSSYDMRHRFTAAYVYSPVGRKWWNRELEIRGITTVQSGQPFTPILRFDNSNTGNTGGIFGSDRPDLLRSPALSRRRPEQWFDTGALVIPARYTFGSAGRNVVAGPGVVQFDIAVARRWALREGPALSLDLQIFNLFNRPQFDLPERFADEPSSLGKIFSAKASRQIQVAIRLGF